MIIDDFKRNEANEVVAVCGAEEVVLSAAYIAEFKPQVGDELVVQEPKVEETPEETK
jgi:hypothetical protein